MVAASGAEDVGSFPGQVSFARHRCDIATDAAVSRRRDVTCLDSPQLFTRLIPIRASIKEGLADKFYTFAFNAVLRQIAFYN